MGCRSLIYNNVCVVSHERKGVHLQGVGRHGEARVVAYQVASLHHDVDRSMTTPIVLRVMGLRLRRATYGAERAQPGDGRATEGAGPIGPRLSTGRARARSG